MPYDEDGEWYEGIDIEVDETVFGLPGAHLPSAPNPTDEDLERIFGKRD